MLSHYVSVKIDIEDDTTHDNVFSLSHSLHSEIQFPKIKTDILRDREQ